MLKFKLLAVASLVAATAGLAQPASALALKTGPSVTGGITVTSDFTACATLTFASGGLMVGEFAAVGEMQGPNTKVGTVRGAIPILANGTWSGCIPGAYAGATVGDGKFTLTAHGVTEDYVEAQQCVINNGVITCF